MAYWLFKSARDYTRMLVPFVLQGRATSWSAPPTIDCGDLALLYEIGEPTDPLDAQGRKHIEWVLRAQSTAVPDDKWPYVAEFEMAPLVPLPLHIAKRSRRFAEGPGANMQGSYNELDSAIWKDLVKLIDVQNPGFEARMSTVGGQDRVFDEVLRPDDSAEGAQSESVGARSRPSWPNKRLMQAQVAEAIFDEGWGGPVNTEELGLGLQTVRGYQLPGTNQYADDLLLLYNRNVVFVYEVDAHGEPDQSVQRAVKCRNALRAKHPEASFSAVVIAESFSLRERDVANQSAVECLRANLSVELEVEFTHADFVHGPVWKARRELEEKTPQE